MKQYNWEQDQIAHMKVNYKLPLFIFNIIYLINNYICRKYSLLIFIIVNIFYRTTLHVLDMEVLNLLDKLRVKKKH